MHPWSARRTPSKKTRFRPKARKLVSLDAFALTRYKDVSPVYFSELAEDSDALSIRSFCYSDVGQDWVRMFPSGERQWDFAGVKLLFSRMLLWPGMCI